MHSENLNVILSGVRADFHGRPFIGFCGSAQDADIGDAELFLTNLIDLIGVDFVAVCGGTKGGIPELASNVCVDNGVAVIGVTPSRVKTEKLLPHLSHVIRVPSQYDSSEWGDESPVLVKLCHAIVFFGGGWGTMIELSHAMKINTSRKSKDKKRIALAPIPSFGGLLKGVAPILQTSSCILRGNGSPVGPQEVARFLQAHLEFTSPAF